MPAAPAVAGVLLLMIKSPLICTFPAVPPVPSNVPLINGVAVFVLDIIKLLLPVEFCPA